MRTQYIVQYNIEGRKNKPAIEEAIDGNKRTLFPTAWWIDTRFSPTQTIIVREHCHNTYSNTCKGEQSVLDETKETSTQKSKIESDGSSTDGQYDPKDWK